jgi:hypothetical protein
VETISPTRIQEQRFVYSAKFLCGTIAHSANPQLPPKGQPLVPGTYLTAVNIHNPNPFPVVFTKKALVTNPQGQPRGKIGRPVEEKLEPNEGLELDCDNIARLLEMQPALPDSFLKGFVVITTPAQELDVVAVYTLKNVVGK